MQTGFRLIAKHWRAIGSTVIILLMTFDTRGVIAVPLAIAGGFAVEVIIAPKEMYSIGWQERILIACGIILAIAMVSLFEANLRSMI